MSFTQQTQKSSKESVKTVQRICTFILCSCRGDLEELQQHSHTLLFKQSISRIRPRFQQVSWRNLVVRELFHNIRFRDKIKLLEMSQSQI